MSLRVVVMIFAILVNTDTHRQLSTYKFSLQLS